MQDAGRVNPHNTGSAEDWRAIQETLYLTSLPGMRESIQEGLKSPIEECGEELEW